MSLINPAILDAMIDMARETPPGDFAEVGVYRGGSAARLADLARRQERRLFLFDTFTGIPEATPEVDAHKIGDFSDTSVDLVRSAVGPEPIIVVGDATETLPETETGPLAFVHLDCDQYATYRAAIIELMPRMVRGGVMWFDDVADLPGARRAVEELFGKELMAHDCMRHYVRF